MKGTPAIYLGRIVDKAHFRTKVYGPNGEKKLVESWDAFEAAMQSGVWFATMEDAKESVAAPIEEVEQSDGILDEVKDEPKPETKAKPKQKSNGKKIYEPPQKAEVIPDDGLGFEVTDESKLI